MPRFTWPGPARNSLRQRRWLLTSINLRMRQVVRPKEKVPLASVLIFTLNEELHLPSCLDCLGWSDDVIVVELLQHGSHGGDLP